MKKQKIERDSMAKRKVLVTGGTGFIGKHLVSRLLNDNFEVVVTVRKTDFEKKPGVSYHFCDIRDRGGVIDAANHSDFVVNLAGVLGTSLDESNTRDSVDVNINGALNVFNAVKAYGLRCIHLSVGNIHWLNNYSTTKYASERLAIMYNKELQTKITVIRAFNVYGPAQKHEPIKKAIPNFIINALKNQPLKIYGDGNQKMDFIFVDDMVELIMRNIEHEQGLISRTQEAGTGKAISVNELAQTIIDEANSKSIIEHLPMRKGEPETSIHQADISTLESLDYVPSTTISDGIRKTIPYYKNLING